MPVRFILFFAVICPLFAAAQTNYKEGYVITDAGDTMRGFINYREWYNNPFSIDFRSANGTTVMNITPAAAREVTITGFYTYQRFEVAISMNPVSFEKLTDTANTTRVTKTVFLKKLLTGDHLGLYSYVDKLKVRFYILSAGKNTPEELLYLKTVDDMQEQTQNIYRQQLKQFAAQYETYSSNLEKRIQSCYYTESSLADIVSRINTVGENKAKTGKTRLRSISYFAGVGITQARINYTGNDLITADGLDGNGNNRYKKITTTNLSPRIAVGINFYSKQWVHRLSLKAELSAYRFASTTTSYTRYVGTTAENHYTFHLNGWSFTLTPGAIYKLYNSSRLKAYLGAGLGMGFLITSKNSIYKTGVNQPLTYNETTNDYLPLGKLNLTFTARAGVVLNQKIDLYIYGSSPAQYNVFGSKDFSVKTGVLAFCAAYTF